MKWLSQLFGRKEVEAGQLPEKPTMVDKQQESAAPAGGPTEGLPSTKPPVTIVCCNCGIRYFPGHNAIIVTAGEAHQALLGSGLKGVVGPGAELRMAEFSYRGTLATFGSPDLIMFRNWSEMAEDEKRSRRVTIHQVLTNQEAFRRTWKCEKCKTEQHYPLPGPTPTPALSEEQQKALFLRLSVLYKLASGTIMEGTGSPYSAPVSAQVAQWAVPYAERIRHAEGFARQDGDFDKAIAEFLDLQRVLPTAALVLMNIGVCYGEKKQDTEARSWLKKALQYVPREYEHIIEQNLAPFGS